MSSVFILFKKINMITPGLLLLTKTSYLKQEYFSIVNLISLSFN